MTGYKIVNLAILIEESGEDVAKSVLSTFSCPLNPDVEYFIKSKAIEFAKQGWAQTHLVFVPYKGTAVLAGYFALANKYIRISSKFLHDKSATLRKRIAKFANYDGDLKSYILSAPLIAQLGKNYTEKWNTLISGDILLEIACNKISKIQFDLGGRYAYVECEDKEPLLSFYERNGFCDFDRRSLDADEVNKLSGDYLVQLLKYIRKGESD